MDVFTLCCVHCNCTFWLGWNGKCYICTFALVCRLSTFIHTHVRTLCTHTYSTHTHSHTHTHTHTYTHTHTHTHTHTRAHIHACTHTHTHRMCTKLFAFMHQIYFHDNWPMAVISSLVHGFFGVLIAMSCTHDARLVTT